MSPKNFFKLKDHNGAKPLFKILLLNLFFLIVGISLFFIFNNLHSLDKCEEGWKIEKGDSKKIKCHEICREVKNNCEPPIFVPTVSAEEWNQFISNHPSCVDVSSCTFTLSVSKSGSGSGTVISNPSGINCGTVCSATFLENSQVTLYASPSSNSVFEGWSGDCLGSNLTCTLVMNSNKSVTATFRTSGGGGGEPPPPEEDPCEGIDCGPCHGCSSVEDGGCCSYGGQRCLYGEIVDIYYCVSNWCNPIQGECRTSSFRCTCATGEKCQ